MNSVVSLHVNRSAVKTLLLLMAYILLAVLLPFGAAEIVLRLRGYAWTPITHRNEPVMLTDDPVLGWKPVPGTYVYPGYSPGADDIRVTIEGDGSRATAPARRGGAQNIVFSGDSFTFGWGLSDDQTYAWKIRERFPSMHVINHGVGGYGTYQSLLRLRQVLADPPPGPVLVMLGYTDFQQDRNVALWSWLKDMDRFERRGHLTVPYVLLQQGSLREYPPSGYPHWPLRERLATVGFAQELFMRVQTEWRRGQRQEVTEELLRKLHAVSESAGAEFAVILLVSSQESLKRYGRMLTGEDIPWADCTSEAFGTPEMQVQGEGHPNETMNEYWADCIETFLRGHSELLDTAPFLNEHHSCKNSYGEPMNV